MARKSLERARVESYEPERSQARSSEVSAEPTPSAAPLDAVLRARMEPGFHFDFSQVRVHADSAAHRLADAANAVAFTTGADIFFSEGAFAPHTDRGDELIAHELAHVVQRASSSAPSSMVSRGTDAAEGEAAQGAASVLAGGSAGSLGAAPAVVAREEKGGEEKESVFGTLSELLKSPEDTGAKDVLSNKELGGVLPESVFKYLSPVASGLGVFGGYEKARDAAAKGDALGTLSGATSSAGSFGGMLGWGAKELAGNSELGSALGGMGNMFSAVSSGMDAFGDFRDGNYGKAALDTTKTAASSMSGLATLGGFEMTGSMLTTEAGTALFGGEGLAALGPAGAVLGSGLAGYGIGTQLLGGANSYAKNHDLFGDHRDSTEAAADAGVSVRDYFHDSWAGGVGDVFGDVAGGITAAGGGIVTAGISGVHAAGSAIGRGASAVGGAIADGAGAVADFFSGPSIMDVVQQQIAAQEISQQLGDTMTARDNEEMRRELYGN